MVEGEQGSISSTVNMQLFREQILKAPKNQSIKQLFALSGSACVKATCKHVDEIDPNSSCRVVLGVRHTAGESCFTFDPLVGHYLTNSC